jgi:hypothetical protein
VRSELGWRGVEGVHFNPQAELTTRKDTPRHYLRAALPVVRRSASAGEHLHRPAQYVRRRSTVHEQPLVEITAFNHPSMAWTTPWMPAGTPCKMQS